MEREARGHGVHDHCLIIVAGARALQLRASASKATNPIASVLTAHSDHLQDPQLQRTGLTKMQSQAQTTRSSLIRSLSPSLISNPIPIPRALTLIARARPTAASSG